MGGGSGARTSRRTEPRCASRSRSRGRRRRPPRTSPRTKMDPEGTAAEALRPLILVLEDEPQVMRVLRAALPVNGYRVAEATSGHQALVEAATRAPDLVLLDLGLPDLDGVEITRRLRPWARVPAVVISALRHGNGKIQ